MSHLPGDPSSTWCPIFRAKFNARNLRAQKKRGVQAAAWRQIEGRIDEVYDFFWSVIDGEPQPVPEWLGSYADVSP